MLYKNKNLNVNIRRPKIKITNDNHMYLQLLDLLENYYNINIEAENPHKIILKYIDQQNYDYIKILYYAKLTKNMKAIENLVMLMEI